MRYAEENGETDEVIRNMALAATAAAEEARMRPIVHTEDPETGEETDPTERVSALARIGTIPEHTTDPVADPSRIPAKKRLGRPPLNKNPLGVIAGTNTKKRRVTQIRISPKRRNAPASSTRGATAKRLKGATQGGQAPKSQPPTKIIPGMVKRKVDFQNPHALIP